MGAVCGGECSDVSDLNPDKCATHLMRGATPPHLELRKAHLKMEREGRRGVWNDSLFYSTAARIREE